METITEDYVSFEIAKLLKEKGFNESCYTYYDNIDDTINRFDKGYHFNNTSYPWGVPYDVNKAKKYVVAPTLQMAMKWLREVHNLYIDIRININNSLYSFRIYSVGISGARAFTEYRIKSYEAACEEAIKYCLENLI